jgi:glyoxalase family protein
MAPATPGLHHITAIAGDPDANAGFYVDTLGLRMVKRTVNHDDPSTYHFYFGDGEGSPGTNITFFPWTADGRPGAFGAGQTRTIAYLIPEGSVEFWTERLARKGVDYERTERFDETVLRFADPDGVELELVAADAPSDAVAWAESPVPEAYQLRGFYGVTLAVAEYAPTAEILTDVLGFELAAETDDRRRYRSGPGGPGSIVDLVETDRGRGRMGVGTVHHVAFEAADVAEQEAWREAYAEAGLRPTDVVDRIYFRSVYVREPGGVLFEMATPKPGFTVDEDRDELGTQLVLPEWLENEREQIEARLPAFDGPPVGGGR